ncbi:MAG: serine/threonine-protein kinase [Deltaproteobacteria bacterium]|nr:serine/threonine-protein kinase [Deltaproteobacteria bacterium]
MEPDAFEEIERLFARAAGWSPETRATKLSQWLEEGIDPKIVAAVERLIEADIESDEVLSRLVDGGASRFLSSIALPQPADHIGPYRLIRELGRGGMGCVYLASRDDGHFEHEVAVKLLRHDSWHRDLLEHFQSERQILARLSHPNIAVLHDGGAETDFLYFVMEHVDGPPIDTYCDDNGLTLADRLTIFLQVCAGVDFAHRRQVVHCDLKPSNILVDENGQAKLLDFGIARLLGEAGVPSTDGPDWRPLSPRFASPEQVRGEELTAQTDVYSLGVLLYRLACGQWPYPQEGRRDGSPLEVPEAPPLAPSQALMLAANGEAVAHLRGRSRRGLQRQLAGDLDAVLLRALDPDRGSRYASVEQLASDLTNYRNGYPVSARPPSLAYRATRFVGRHRLGMAGLAAVLIILITALAVVEVQTGRAARERDRANQVTESLVDLFEITDHRERDGGTITARELLDRGATQVKELTDDTDRATLTGTLAELYGRLGHYAESAELYEAFLAARGGSARPRRALETAGVHYELGISLAESGRFSEAQAHLTQAYELRRDHLDGDDEALVRSLNALGLVHHDLGRFAQAQDIYLQAVAMDRRLGGGGLSAFGRIVRTNLALLLIDLASYQQAIEMMSKDLEEAAADDDLGDLELAYLQWVRGLAHERAGELELAESDMRFVADTYRLARGPSHPKTASAQSRLGTVLALAGRLEEARPWIMEALETRRDTLGTANPYYALSLEDRAQLHLAGGKLEAAAADLEEALTIYQETMIDYPFATRAMVSLGRAHLALDRPDAAAQVLEDALRLRRQILPPDNPQIAEVEVLLATAAPPRGGRDEAARPGDAAR